MTVTTELEQSLKNQPIIALDFSKSEEVERFLRYFAQKNYDPLWIKIGMELFYSTGVEWLKTLQEQNCRIFLDLKCHDIPHTVYRAMRVLGQFGVQLTTTHAAGGSLMIAAAKKGLMEGAALANLPVPKLLAITQLTSTDEATMHAEQNIQTTLKQSVVNYAKVALRGGADGVVCSAQEANLLYDEMPHGFLKVTPGIRLNHSQNDDQKRVMTPKDAAAHHADAIVVGRAITQSADPYAAWQVVCRQWKNH